MVGGSSKGGIARAAALTADRRKEIASAAAKSRWANVPEKLKPEWAYIYVIGSVDGPQKVGWSTKPIGRLRSLQTAIHLQLACSFELRVACSRAQEVERFAHWLLDENLIRGEWFNAPPSVCAALVQEASRRVLAGETLQKASEGSRGARRTCTFNIRLSDEEMAKLKTKAARLGVTMTDVLMIGLTGEAPIADAPDPTEGAPPRKPTPKRKATAPIVPSKVETPQKRTDAQKTSRQTSRRIRGYDRETGDPIYW